MIHNTVLYPSEDHLLLSVSQPAGCMPWLVQRWPRLGRLWAELPHGNARITRGIRVDIGTGNWKGNIGTTPSEEPASSSQTPKQWSEPPDLSRHALTPRTVGPTGCEPVPMISPGPGEKLLLWDATDGRVLTERLGPASILLIYPAGSTPTQLFP